MPNTLARIFGRSPFAPLLTHMAKVAQCVDKLLLLFQALKEGNFEEIERLSVTISQLEHEADLTKNDIRNHLPNGLFLPIARSSLLEILAIQDSIADATENIGILLTYRKIRVPPSLIRDFDIFLHKNLETFEGGRRIILELHELLESSFGGTEAEKVCAMVEDVAFKEHESDLLQRALLKKLFELGDSMQQTDFYLWNKLIREIARLSDLAEKLANRIRMTLEVKG